jgi:ABC-type multidrug transport system fused ATPase/permease subunit
MVEWRGIALRIGLLAVGCLIALALKPFIILLVLGLVILAVAMIVFAFIPGGWIVSSLGGRLLSWVLFTRFGLAIILAILGFLGSLALGDWVLFLAGGLALMLLAKPPSIFSRGRQKAAQKVQETKIEKFNAGGGLFRKSLLTIDSLESGIIVTGEEANDVGRTLIQEARRLGRKVIIIGESSYLVPGNSGRVKASRAEAFNVVDDFLKNPASVEAFTYAFALANKLENDDIPLILVAAHALVRDLQAGNISRDDVIKAIPDQIQDRRGNLIKSVLSLCSFIGSRGLSFTSLGDDWDTLYISVRDLPQRQAVFAMAYSIYMLSGYNAVLVLHNPEKLLPDINLLAYNARESWERAFNTIASWRDRGLGLILVSRSPMTSPYLLRLCPTILASRMPEVPGRLDDELMRQVVKAARGIKPGELVASTADRLMVVKYRAPEPAYIPPPKHVEKPQEARAVVTAIVPVGGGAAEEFVEEPKKAEPTALEKEFGEKVMDAARILQQARSGLPADLQGAGNLDAGLVKRLEEKGYLTQFGGLYYTSATGLELLNEYQRAVKGRGAITIAEAEKPSEAREEAQKEAQEGAREAEARQAILDQEEALDRLGEHVAGYYLAESLFRQGKYAQSVMKSYEFMVNALKAFYSIDKGHLDDIVEALEGRGAEKPLAVNEAKDAKALTIEASKALKDGKQVQLTSAQRMLRYAKKVLEHLSRGESGEG